MYTYTHLHGISVYHSMYTSMNISIPLRVLVLICMRPVFSGHNETFQFTSGHHYQTGHPAMNGFRTIHYNVECMNKISNPLYMKTLESNTTQSNRA